MTAPTKTPATAGNSPMPMGEAFTYQANRDPDRFSIICADDEITRGELESQANRAAREFAELGVKQDDLVTIALPNGIDFYVATAAIWKLGAVRQPLSYRLPDLERDAIIELANPSLVVGVDPDRVIGRPALAAGWQPSKHTSDEPRPTGVLPSWVAFTSGVVSGGANIYPTEVEAALERHDLVRSAAVIGLPDDDLGQRAHVIVDVGETAESTRPDDDALKARLRDHSASYKIPRSFEFVTGPLRNDAGKVRRSALRDERIPTSS